MKFLEYTSLDSINIFLSHLNLGESTIKGNLEAFSCKHTGSDRKLSISLEHEEWATANGGSSLLESMSKAIDEIVQLGECEICSYNPDFDWNPGLENGAIWLLNFFFYNRKLKRIVSFRCCCLSNLAADDFIGDGRFIEDEEDDLLRDMDM